MSGSNKPMPIACKTRANINISKLKASAAINVPTIKLMTEPTNSLLVENICNSNPLIGIKIPRVNMKPVVNHCAVAAEIWNTSIKLVNAIFIAVSLNIPTAPLMSNAVKMARVLYCFFKSISPYKSISFINSYFFANPCLFKYSSMKGSLLLSR